MIDKWTVNEFSHLALTVLVSAVRCVYLDGPLDRSCNMKRPTELYPRAWFAHHRLQFGPNWKAVEPRFYATMKKELQS